MSNRSRKLDCHAQRKARHERKRAEKRRAAKAYSKQTPKSQRRTVQFPAIWNMPVKAWTRKVAA